MTPSADRLRRLTLELVEVASPTGDTVEVMRLYGERLAEIGMDVMQWADFPGTGTLVARLPGGEPGPRLALQGHLDTVPLTHEPPRVEGDLIFGRGAADMKGAMACAAEAARLLAESRPFAGELLIVAIGLHEAPVGRGQDLLHLLRERRLACDAAVVCELASDSLPVAHMGSATFEVAITRPGIPTHELQTPAGTPHPLLAAGRVVAAIEAESARLAEEQHEWVGAETIFLGELHGGDFYNRYPTTCRLVGTRRWAPGRTLAEVELELETLLAPISESTGCSIELELEKTRDAYRIDPSHHLAQALIAAYRNVTGRELTRTGIKVVADGAILQNDGGIPTVYHGPGGTGAHADVESIAVSELVRATRVYVELARLLSAEASASASPPNGTRA